MEGEEEEEEEEKKKKAKDDDDLHVRYDSYRIILYGAGGMILCTICTYRTSTVRIWKLKKIKEDKPRRRSSLLLSENRRRGRERG
jgi:hypothetical protein